MILGGFMRGGLVFLLFSVFLAAAGPAAWGLLEGGSRKGGSGDGSLDIHLAIKEEGGYLWRERGGLINLRERRRESPIDDLLLLIELLVEKRNDARLAKKVKTLLEVGSDPNAMNSLGETPLFLARRYPLTFRLLLLHGASPGLSDPEGKTVLQKIIEENDFDFRLALAPAREILRDRASRPPADIGGQMLLGFLPEVIKKQRAFNPYSEIMRQARPGEKLALAFVQSRADLAQRDEGGNLPVFFAAQLWDQRIACKMIEAGGIGCLSDSDREKLFRLAASRDKIIGELQKRGFFSFLDSSGQGTAARLSIETGSGPANRLYPSKQSLLLIWLLESIHPSSASKKAAFALIDGGADLSQRNERGESPLYLALGLKRPQIAHKIIEAQPGLDYLPDQEIEEAALMAARKGHKKAARLLHRRLIQREGGKCRGSFFGP